MNVPRTSRRQAALIVGAAVVATLIGAWLLSGRTGGGPIPVAGAGEKFDALDCQGRYFESSPALAVMFAAPVDSRQRFSERIAVLDLGDAPPKKREADAAKKKSRGANPPAEPKGKAAGDKAKAVNTAWVLGDNPRALYLPQVTPGHRYRIALRADLASATNESLGRNLECEVTAEAMPPAFFFASRGTVLPARLNGGLPVITVNVPEIDVQFLRVEPAQLPRFLERVAGRKAKATEPRQLGRAGDDDDDDEPNYEYQRPRGPQGVLESYELDSLRTYARSVYLGRFVTDPRANRRNVTHLPVETVKELQEPGIYIAVMSEPGRFKTEFQTTYFYVSDIGLHARRSPRSLDVFSTSLVNGRALSGVELQLLDEHGKPMGRVSTDSDGHARFDAKMGQARVLLARHGAQFSVLSLVEPALDLSEFDVGGHLPRNVKIYAYSGRDLYRPGETFEAAILVRDADGQPVPPAPVTATLKRADGKVVQQFAVAPDPKRAGYLQRAVALPQDAQTGTWTLELRADPGAAAADHVMKFQVEEFLPERMKLALKFEKAYLEPDDDFNVDVTGTYLYGAPASGNRLMGNVYTQRGRIPFPQQWPGFEFGDFDDDGLNRREDIEAVTLNAEGQATVTVPVPEQQARSPVSVRATFSLLETGGRPVVRSIERVVFPAGEMIGVRPTWSGKFAREGSVAELEVIRVTPAGQFAPLPKATARFYREDRDWYWVFDDQRGWHSGFNESEELLDTREIDLSRRAKVSFPVRYGRYRVEVLDRATGLTARYRFYAGWGAQDNEALGNRPDRVAIKLDRAGYKPGEEMRVTITPPHAGEALVLVEGDRVLYKRRVMVSPNGTEVKIPIGSDWNRHDLYVTATVFRPGSRREKVTPARALGIAYVPLDSGERKLAVKLTAPDKTQPERELKVKVKAEGLSNEAAIVTLSAVDVGILNITNYRTPDAFDFFLGKHRYAPDVLDLYGKFIETMEGSKGRLKFGGDSRQRDSRETPRKVKLVDLFSGPVALDAKGEAEITLQIPDFNGTLRLMAVVNAPRRFGSADKEVVSAAPIVAELAMPRFVSPGDQATLALDLANMTEQAQSLRVAVTSGGPLKLTGAEQGVVLKPKEKKTIRFTAEPTDAIGLVPIQVSVKSAGEGGINIRREAALAISPLTPPERTRRFQRLGAGESAKLDAALVEGLHGGSALASLTFSTMPPVNVADHVKGLLAYPYGCLEQTTSRAFPHVLVDEKMAQSLGLKAFSPENREKALGDAISRIAGLQRASGAFTLWGEGVEEPWLTAYVSDFLRQARKAGQNVPENMTKKADEWMLGQLQKSATLFPKLPARPKDKEKEPTDSIARDASWWAQSQWRIAGMEGHRRLGALAYMGYVLAQDERAPLGSLRLLHDDYRDRALSPLPLVHLALALKRMGDEKRAQEALDRAFSVGYGMTGYEWEWLGDYGTRLRDTALAYALLEREGVAHPRRDNLVAELAELLPRSRWLSTQEQTALVMAGRELGRGGGKEWSARLAVGNEAEAMKGSSTEMRELDGEKLRRGAVLTNTGADSMFVAIETFGYPVKARAGGDAITFRRALYTPTGAPVGERTLRVGEQVLVHVEVTTTRNIPDGLVVDRIPAGLEIENLNLSQGNRLEEFKAPPAGAKRKPVPPAQAMSDPKIKHREFRDDRFVVAAQLNGTMDLYYLARVVTPGLFTLPPSYAEDMYRPELRGLSPVAGTLRVEDAAK